MYRAHPFKLTNRTAGGCGVAAIIVLLIATVSYPEAIAGVPPTPAKQSQVSRSPATTVPSDHELLRLIFPDIGTDGNAHKSVQIRNLHGDYKPTRLDVEMTVRKSASRFLRNGTDRDLMLVLDVSHTEGGASPWGGELLLALFRLSPKARLLDVVDVRSDRESGLWNDPDMLHADGYDCPVVYGSHLNAGEEFFSLELVELVHDKFVQSRVSLPSAYNARGETSAVAEKVSFQSSPHSRAPAVAFRIKVTGTEFDEDSGETTRLESKTFETKLFASGGRWQCSSCRRMEQSISAMEKRFGFSDE